MTIKQKIVFISDLLLVITFFGASYWIVSYITI